MDKDMKNDTSLTPLELIKKLGKFDLDPCGLNFHKTAGKIIEWPNDGLSENWAGRVWCNPPYSNPTPWLDRLSRHNNGIALVLNSTDTEWFQEYVFNRQCGVLFLKGRPKFMRKDLSRFQIMRGGLVLIAYGVQNMSILENSGISGSYIEMSF